MRCPTCRRETVASGNPYRPFCSERCRLADLGRWLREDYRVAGEPVRDDAPPAGEEEEES